MHVTVCDVHLTNKLYNNAVVQLHMWHIVSFEQSGLMITDFPHYPFISHLNTRYIPCNLDVDKVSRVRVLNGHSQWHTIDDRFRLAIADPFSPVASPPVLPYNLQSIFHLKRSPHLVSFGV